MSRTPRVSRRDRLLVIAYAVAGWAVAAASGLSLFAAGVVEFTRVTEVAFVVLTVLGMGAGQEYGRQRVSRR